MPVFKMQLLCATLLALIAGVLHAQLPQLQLSSNTEMPLSAAGTPRLATLIVRDLPRVQFGTITLHVLRITRAGECEVAQTRVEQSAGMLRQAADSDIITEARVHFEVHLRPLTFAVGDLLTFVATVRGTQPEAPALTASSNTVISANYTASPAVQACVCAFVSALGVSKDAAAGRVTLSASADCSAVRTAEQQLRACLATCDPPQTQIPEAQFTCGDVTITIKLCADGGASTNAVVQSNQSDIVVAIAGNGSGSSTGGQASATNRRRGGATLAIGGQGGGAGRGAAGGTATALSEGNSSEMGDSYAVGGDGGNGTTGGGAGATGSATTTDAASTAFSQGGDGGTPTTAPDSTSVGKGGNCSSAAGAGSSTNTGAGQPGSPVPSIPAGSHGEGGWTRNTPAGTTGHNGVLLPNS